MHISAFHISGFGLFNNVGLDHLAPGLTIFFGLNEAGKSTCLEFFRVMLTGYPEKGARSRRSFEPLKGGAPGGSLTLGWRGGELRLSRAPAAQGGLRLHDAQGAPLHVDVLARAMGGIDRDLYNRYFGFSIDELSRWDKKAELSARNALFGASFGAGLASPGEALARLEAEMGKIFKARGSRQPLNLDLAELGAIRGRIEILRRENAEYGDIAEALAAKKEELAQASARRAELELRARILERRLAKREQWEDWQLAETKLRELPEEPAGLPEDAQALLSRLESERAACERDVASASERLRQLAANAEAIKTDTAILAEADAIERHCERKGGYRHASKQMTNLEEAVAKHRSDLQAGLALLGAEWSCERIRQTDRSIFAREELEKLATAMTETRMAHRAAMLALQSANAEAERAKEALARTESDLAEMPEPAIALTDAERDSLRAALARLDESDRLAQRRALSFENARQAFNRALAQSRLAGDDEQKIEHARDLAAAQEQGLALAEEARQSLRIAEDAASKAEEAETALAALKTRLDEAQARFGGASSTREGLENRVRALRALRGAGSALQAEEERKRELDARIAAEREPVSTKNWFLIVFGMVFLLGAVGIFCAWWFYGIDHFQIAEGMNLPINHWAAYAALFCGVVLLGAGFSVNAAERERRKNELARLLSRSETGAMRLAELSSQARQLAQEAGIEDFDPIAIDAMEALLEREKEQLLDHERSGRELDALRAEYARASKRAQKLAEETYEKAAITQQARKRWQQFIQNLGAEDAPPPEGAPALFARAETARAAAESWLAARRDKDDYQEERSQAESAIAAVPAVAAIMAAEPEMGLDTAANTVLSSAREADAARELRLARQREVDSAREQADRAKRAHAEAYARLEAEAANLGKCRSEWGACLAALGLKKDLDPETARAAYRQMEECLAAEEALSRSIRELEAARTEIAAFEDPLKAMLARLQREPDVDSDGRPDWLATLDKLAAAAREQARLKGNMENLRLLAATQKDIVGGKEAALAQAQRAEADLLAAAGATDRDELLRFAALRDERRALCARAREAQASLAQAGRDDADFLASFELESRIEQEKELLEARQTLGELAEAERNLATEAGQLAERAARLENSDELADLRQRESMLMASIQTQAQTWSSLALAKTLLEEARKIYEKERQPELIRIASRYFEEITGGRWRGLCLDLEDNSLLALPASGEPVESHNLSRGAQEQAYLALRLAHIERHGASGEPLPVIMDEILVNFDPRRARHTAAAFARLCAGGAQQLLYFTCQPHIVKMLREEAPDARLVLVKNGEISAEEDQAA